jgi:hypothetical protein
MGSTLAESPQLPKSSLPKINESPLRCREWINTSDKSCLADGNTRILAAMIASG